MSVYTMMIGLLLLIGCTRERSEEVLFACLSTAVAGGGREPLPSRSCFEVEASRLTESEKRASCQPEGDETIALDRVSACPAGAVVTCADHSQKDSGITYFYDSTLRGRSCEEIETLIGTLLSD